MPSKPPVKLTIDAIDRLKPEATRYSVAVAGHHGLVVRVAPSGVKTFGYVYRGRDGHRQRYTVGRFGQVTPEVVKAEYRRLGGQVAVGGSPQDEKRAARRERAIPTLGEFVAGEHAHWLEHNQRDGPATTKRLAAAFGELLGTRVDELTAWQVEKWRTARRRGGTSEATVNRDLAALRGALRRAREWGVIATNPLATVRAHRVGRWGRTRFLSAEEERRLREALDAREQRIWARRARYQEWRARRHLEVLDGPSGRFADHLKPMVLVALNTGVRRGELFALEWSSVDLRHRNLRVLNSTSKSRETRDVPLNDEALGVLRAWRAQQRDTAGLVFPNRAGGRFDNVRKAWAGVLVEAGIDGFSFHDLRHTFASKLVMRGVDLNSVRELLGHADIAMTLRYAHLAPEHKADAVAKLNVS